MSVSARARLWLPREPDPAATAAALLAAAKDLAATRTVEDVGAVVRSAARKVSGADGVTFVLREGELVHYLDEDAIGPLWKGSRFPASACISGWAMIHRTPVAIEDVYADDRIPHDLYRPTFVRSLLMMPVRPEAPVAAIGAYWARLHRATSRELDALTALAGLASVALANVALFAELRDALRARDEFLQLASHELRTPMTPLRLDLGAALRRIEQGRPDEARSLVVHAAASLDRLGALVDDLLDASRIAERAPELLTEEVDLSALAREAVERLGAAGSVVEVIAGAPVRATVDRRRIAQVLASLLSNALRFGLGEPIQLRIEADGGEARIAIRDRGVGIAPADQARIFERFERAASVRHFGGLGLGLWLVREIVRAHGGRVELASRPGEGATFVVALPLSPKAY